MTHRVLIHRPGSLGDTVVALPCLRLIRRRFPDSEIRVPSPLIRPASMTGRSIVRPIWSSMSANPVLALTQQVSRPP